MSIHFLSCYVSTPFFWLSAMQSFCLYWLKIYRSKYSPCATWTRFPFPLHHSADFPFFFVSKSTCMHWHDSLPFLSSSECCRDAFYPKAIFLLHFSTVHIELYHSYTYFLWKIKAVLEPDGVEFLALWQSGQEIPYSATHLLAWSKLSLNTGLTFGIKVI